MENTFMENKFVIRVTAGFSKRGLKPSPPPARRVILILFGPWRTLVLTHKVHFVNAL
jgi:hypothetical protein